MQNPDPVAFTLFGKSIYWYGITMASGVLAGLALALRAAKHYRWKQDDLLDFIIMAIPISLICARTYYVIFEWELYAAEPISALYIWQGGLALYGSLIGGVLSALIFTRWKKLPLCDLLDICAPSFALGQAIGRWGNFFNQEAFGIEVTNPALEWFPLAVKIDATNTIHYATFFYESVWCLLLCVFLTLTRKKYRHRYDVLLTYLMLYGFERMMVEGLRTDSLYITGTSIRVSQLLSGVLFFGLLIFMTVRHFKENGQELVITNKANPAYIWPEEHIAGDAETQTDISVDAAGEPDGDKKADDEPADGADGGAEGEADQAPETGGEEKGE